MDSEFDYNQVYETNVKHDSDEGSLSPLTFLILVGLLLVIGLACMYSASFPEAVKRNLPHYYFFIRQLAFAVLGIVAAFIVNLIPFRFYKYGVVPLLLFSVFSMLMTSFTPFGITINGARRWLQLPYLPAFQPSEVVKFSMILFLSYYLGNPEYRKNRLKFFSTLFLSIVLFSLMIVNQRAYTNMILFLIISAAILISGQVSLKYIITTLIFLSVPSAYILLGEGYRVRRIASFLFPKLDPSGLGYQTGMAINAIREGGFVGKGLGEGSYKYGLLPEVQNDFIFANIVEELGWVGAIFIILLFCFLALIGFRSAQRISRNNMFLSLLAIGITTSITAQVILNIAVVTGLLPPTGIPLSFFSQGGTNLFITLIECGILYKIIKTSVVDDRI